MINKFRGEYAWLSNMFLAPIALEGEVYPSSENLYQAAKTEDTDIHKQMQTVTPSQAKRMSRTFEWREDWDAEKNEVMEHVLVLKFTQHPDLAQKLIETGDELLIEGNWWHDNYWGSCECPRCGNQGMNYLGQILMTIRRELQES